MELPYLRLPCFLDAEELRFSGTVQRFRTSIEAEIFARIYSGGPTLDEVAGDLARGTSDLDVDAARERLRARFGDPDSVVGLASVEVDDAYDIVVVDQGYGGVYVHTIELLKQLGLRWKCLLICPENPLFDDSSGTDVVTLKQLRKTIPGLSYFSFVHLVRTLVRRIRCKLLVLTHRSQSLFLFDLVRSHRTVIYCDGYYDGGFSAAENFRLDDTVERRREILGELYYVLGNGHLDFYGMTATPFVNLHVLAAGSYAIRDSLENWCWGNEQTLHFQQAYPGLADRIKFMPPFTEPDLFHPDWVERERTVLFTTTMHNIEKKGFPELLRAMRTLRDLRVRCVVRQPQHLPPIPAGCRSRMEIGSIPKHDMVRLYHRVWLNCRVSREESSPVSILESMICEVPQVTSTVVARQIPILEDGRTGFVLDPDDRMGIARALRALTEDADLRDRMGRECRERALQYSYPNREQAFTDLMR